MDQELLSLQKLLADEETNSSEAMVIDHLTPAPQAEGLNSPVDLEVTATPKRVNPIPPKSGSAARTGRIHKRLSGAAKKRIQRWMALGKPFAEARALCHRPLEEFPDVFPEFSKAQTRSAKRPRDLDASASSSPGTQPGKIPNTQPSPSLPPNHTQPSPSLPPNPSSHPPPAPSQLASTTSRSPPPSSSPTSLPNHPIPPPPSFREVAASFRVGVENITRPMTEGELELVKEAILKLSDEAAKGEGPNFLGCSVRSGWLLLIFADERSKNWLSANIGKIIPWEGAKLRIMETLPKPRIGVAWIPDKDASQEIVLHRFEIQNPGIDCSLWRVLNRRVEGSGQSLTFSFDEASCETIQSRNCRLFIGFGSAYFRIKARERQDAEAKGRAKATAEDKGLRNTADPTVPSGAVAAPVASAPAVPSSRGNSSNSTPGNSRRPWGPSRPSRHSVGNRGARGGGVTRPVRPPLNNRPSLAQHSSKKAARNPLNRQHF